MTFNHLNRRLHLYLALGLLPWFLMYGISAIPFTRNAYFNSLYKDGVPMWTTRIEQAYDRPAPDNRRPDTLQKFAKEVVTDLNLKVTGSLGAYQPNNSRITVYLVDFWHHTRITYNIAQQNIRVEDKRFRWDQFFTTLHARGGYHQDSFLNDLWAFVVDFVALGFLIWTASGIYMWWQLKQTRRWGSLALGGGFLSFLVFLFML
ncbi:MAG: hypothetical protein HOE48_14280 [Candidatus Latescibacteria bacterium]|jgi:hypothetical protein|nr:hypothetical protein [Candidatus Latescibacterota bacterium]